MENQPSELPPAPSTQIVGQQAVPSTAVPTGGGIIVNPAGQTNTLSVVSLVTAVIAPFGHFLAVGGLALIIISLVTGHMARNEIKRTGEAGMGYATAGLVISYIHLALSILAILAVIFILLFFGAVFFTSFGRAASAG